MNLLSLKDKANMICKKAQGQFLRLSKTHRIIVVILAILLVVMIARLDNGKNTDTIQAKSTPEVHVASVAELSLHSSPLTLLGTVTSTNEATIRAEASGKVVGVYKKLGDQVAAGTVIAEFENSTERAQLLQAQGAYEAAMAQKDIAGINSGTTGTSLEETKTQALNTLSSTYTTLDDAVRTKTDSAFRNPQTREAKFIITVSDARLVITLEEERVAIETMLRAREELNNTLSTQSDLVSALSKIETEAQYVRDYLDNLNLALSRAIPDSNASSATIEGLKTSSGIARSAVGGTLQAIATSRNALNMSISADQVANKNYTAGDAGNTATDAALKSALGNLRAAESRLAKTIVRSPISGTINSLSVNTGDFISPFSEIAVVSNNGALEIVAYATEDDVGELSVGSTVTTDKNATGVVTRIAPAIDPKTKKIEVRIGIGSGASELLNGESIRVNIKRKTTLTKVSENNIQIPISALKMTPDGALVFTVDEQQILHAHIVTPGALLGSDIMITKGLTGDMEIVTDARGLKDGMEVSVIH